MKDLYRLFSDFAGCSPESITPLSGAGSNRRYYRLEGEGRTFIGVSGTDVRENESFISLARHFRSKGLPVPEVLAVSEDSMRYIQEDLGDELLADRVAAANKAGGIEPESPLAELLCRTMALLPQVQFDGAKDLDFSVCYPQPSFDRRMVMFDLNYFKYCFLKPSGTEFNEVLLQNDFDRLADDLLEEDNGTFLYRDFNARNVMIKENCPYLIDFQGGRRGPVYYDVASFVWQARARYPQWLKKRMVDVYVDVLSGYMPVVRDVFDSRLLLFRLFRTLQVLGAYGFRGLVENKAQFVVCIPQAVSDLKELLPEISESYPYLHMVLEKMADNPRFANVAGDGRLEVKVYSFSYKKGIPQDLSGNGGGYVFDCRYIHNPGRYEPYKKLTGRDEEVIRFLEDDGEITGFLEHVYGVVDPHVETYSRRGFTSLMVSFGCTGGQHRSVYCAEHLAHHLADKYPEIRIRLIHREQHIEESWGISS